MPHAAGHEGEEYEIEPSATASHSRWDRFTAQFNRHFNRLLDSYEYWVKRALVRPGLTVAILSGAFFLAWQSIRFSAWHFSREPMPDSSPST